MTYTGELHYHKPSGFGEPVVCLYDQEDWPCTVAQVRAQVAAEIEAAVHSDRAYRPEWVSGMTDAAAIARGPHVA